MRVWRFDPNDVHSRIGRFNSNPHGRPKLRLPVLYDVSCDVRGNNPRIWMVVEVVGNKREENRSETSV